jgi:putative ABC transport system permease protein
LADVRPLGGARYSVSKSDKDGKSGPRFDVAAVDPQYFTTMGISIVAGRALNDDDRAGAPPVAVINAAMARTMYPSSSPVGQVLRFGSDTNGVTIVGVMKDVPQRTLEGPPSPAIFPAIAQGAVSSSMTILIQTTGAPESLEKPMREIVRALDPTLPPPTYNVMDDVLSKAVAPRRFNFMLLGMLASLAATLAAVGLYGVMAYLVVDRTQEIGIRIALGAERRRVVGFIVGRGMTLAAAGIVLGLVVSLGAVPLLRNMLYQVNIYDPYSFAAGGLLLAAVAFLACYIPARRAARVDPIVALRGDSA